MKYSEQDQSLFDGLKGRVSNGDNPHYWADLARQLAARLKEELKAKASK